LVTVKSVPGQSSTLTLLNGTVDNRGGSISVGGTGGTSTLITDGGTVHTCGNVDFGASGLTTAILNSTQVYSNDGDAEIGVGAGTAS
jgi:hypothetical protein